MKYFAFLGVVFVIYINELCALPGPVPLPKNFKSSSKAFRISANINITSNVPYCDILQDAIKYYYEIIFRKNIQTVDSFVGSSEILSSINIQVKSACDEREGKKVWPSESMNEMYSLFVHNNEIGISSPEVWGALRSLETLAQLVYRDGTSALFVNEFSITDEPRFKHRGFMIDTARHFIQMSDLYTSIEAMAMSKFNVFHWHIVDECAFPYSSRLFPDMAKKGAYHTQTHVYTQTNIADIMEFARRKGIRVIPEFDTPGHSLSWGKAFPNLLTRCYKGTKPDGTFGPIDPTNNSTYSLLSQLFGEITRVYQDNFLHLGGDEVPFDCWRSNPNIKEFMKKMQFGDDYSKLESYYINRLVKLVYQAKPKQKDMKLLVWQEVFDNGVALPKNNIVHVWKGDDKWAPEVAAVTKAGYPTILSSCWYVNYIHYGTDWAPLYACDPHNFNGTQEQKDLVFGGEACMWTEYVDGSNIISRSWPRSSVVAERLWSEESVKSTTDMLARLQDFQCRMRRRGIAAEPITPSGVSYCRDI